MIESEGKPCVRIRAVPFVPARACSFISVIFLFLASNNLWSAGLTGSPKSGDLTEIPIEALMELEVPTVYSASKFEQRTTEAPSSISVVTSDEINRYGYRTIAEVLRSLQGFYVSYDRNYAFLGTRGISLGDFNSRTLLLVDGHRVNNNLTDGAFIDTAFILDIDLVDRVEVIRGPGSILYGNNAFFDVINVETRKGRKLNGVEASVEYGEFETWKGRVTYGQMFTNGIELLLSGSYYDSAGADRLFYREYATNNNGIAQGMDADSYGSFFGSLGYHDFTLEGAFITREKENPTAQFFTTFNDPRLKTVDDRSYVNLKYAHQFADVVDVTARLYYDRSDFNIGYPFGDPVATSFFKESQEGQWWGAELQFSKRIWDRHMITLGGEYRDDFIQNQRVFEPSTGQTFTDNSATRQSYGVYGEGDFAIRTNLHVNAGLRLDRYGDFDAKLNPRIGLIYNPFESSTIKALYGTAFRTPNFLELSDPRFQDIQPEEITTYELVYEQAIGRHLRSSISGFYNQMDHLIVFESGSYTNLDADTKGVEIALEAGWTNGIKARASYTFQNVNDRSRDREFADSPEHLIKGNVSVPLYLNKIFAGLEVQFTSHRGTLYTSTTGETIVGSGVPSFAVLNFTLFSQNLIKNLDFSASVYNLLHNEYADPATRFHLQDRILNDGRSFRLKLTYRF